MRRYHVLAVAVIAVLVVGTYVAFAYVVLGGLVDQFVPSGPLDETVGSWAGWLALLVVIAHVATLSMRFVMDSVSEYVLRWLLGRVARDLE